MNQINRKWAGQLNQSLSLALDADVANYVNFGFDKPQEGVLPG